MMTLHRVEAVVYPSHCFIQMNISGEESKYGLEPEQAAAAFVEQLRAFPHIEPIGLDDGSIRS